jgi:uncharacterized membrane protein
MGLVADPLHPSLVHFPIALMLAAVVFELLARHPRARFLAPAAAVLTVLAALGAVAAVLSGQAARDAAVVPTAAVALLDRHAKMGEIAMWVLIALALLRLALQFGRRFAGWVTWGYLAAAITAAALVAYQGYVGGEVVYRYGVGTTPVQRGASSQRPLQR